MFRFQRNVRVDFFGSAAGGGAAKGKSSVAELREFAKRKDLDVVEYIVESKTAKVPGREQFEQVLKKIENGKANALLAAGAKGGLLPQP